MQLIDLKVSSPECHTPASIKQETTYELRENDIFTTNGIPSCPRISHMRCTIQRQLQGQELHLLGPISLHGIRSTHLSGEPEGYPGMPQRNETQTLPYGHPRERLPQYLGQCQQDQGLAYLLRLCPGAHQEGQKTVRQRKLWRGTGSDSLRPGFHHNRSMSCPVSVGTIPQKERSGQDAHPPGSAGQYSHRGYRYSRTYSRCHYPRSSYNRSRCHIYHGSRLSRLRSSVCYPSDFGFLCNTSQTQLQLQKTVLSHHRQINRDSMRSNHCTPELLCSKELSGKTTENPVSRCNYQQKAGLSYQQFYPSGKNHCGALQMSVARRTLFQMDQATSENQGLLRHLGECDKNTDMDCNFYLCSGSYCKEGVEIGSKSLHYFTDFERHAF